MSRASNRFRRTVEEGLLEREEKLRWMAEAQKIFAFPGLAVSERDWLLFGDRPPSEWLQDRLCDEDEHPWDDEDILDDWYYDVFEEDDRWLDDYDDPRDEDDWRRCPEPSELEYGGRYYPREDILEARRRA